MPRCSGSAFGVKRVVRRGWRGPGIEVCHSKTASNPGAPPVQQSAISRVVTVAAGRFPPGHLGDQLSERGSVALREQRARSTVRQRGNSQHEQRTLFDITFLSRLDKSRHPEMLVAGVPSTRSWSRHAPRTRGPGDNPRAADQRLRRPRPRAAATPSPIWTNRLAASPARSSIEMCVPIPATSAAPCETSLAVSAGCRCPPARLDSPPRRGLSWSDRPVGAVRPGRARPARWRLRHDGYAHSAQPASR
jgi:hypothetical protein